MHCGRNTIQQATGLAGLSAGAALMVALLLGAMNTPSPEPNAASALITPGRLRGAPVITTTSAIVAATRTAIPAIGTSRGRSS